MASLLGTATSKQSARATGAQPVARRSAAALSTGDAEVLLADLGFLLVPGPPLHRGAAYLLVALRPRPTRAHFDPERIAYWSRARHESTPVELEWPMTAVLPDYSWGSIRIVDRLRAENGFASFGGSVSVARDIGVHAALFRSVAPIVALGGHSGPADPIAVHVAAFFARLRGAAGYDSPVKKLADTLTPLELYAAFLVRAVSLGDLGASAEAVSHRLSNVLRAELALLRRDHPAQALAGQRLAQLLAHG